MTAILPIRTEADYELALARVEELMEAAPGTPEFDELEVRSQLIEAYEAKHHPVGPPSPVEAIKFRMDQGGLSQRDLRPFIGSASKVSEVLSGKRPLSVRMIRELHSGLGIPLASLIGDSARQPTQEGEVPATGLLRAMARRAWFGDVGDQQNEELASRFRKTFATLWDRRSRPCLLRQSTRERPVDDAAVMAWRLQTLRVAAAQDLPPFRPDNMTSEFARQLAGLSRLRDGMRAAAELLGSQGVAVVVLQHLPRTRLDGCVALNADGRPTIGLTLRHDRIDHFWFTLLHEVAHVALHLKGDRAADFLDDFDREGGANALEAEADRFASSALIPDEIWAESGLLEDPRSERVAEVAARARVHEAIVAGRVRRELGDFRRLHTMLGHGLVRSTFPGYERGVTVGT
jgi:HTH-type transcriptional regulator / antitoxin HigA